jgi:polyisoprenoid-binding protein YceI
MVGALLVSFLTVGLASAAGPVSLSPQNTRIEWVGTKPGGQHVGGFQQYSGSFDPAAGKLTVEIQTASITSDNNQLTTHLKSGDFFNVRRHPKITFTATKIEPKASGEWTHQITGDLTMLGKKKSITFPAKITTDNGVVLQSSFAIDRTQFGMTYGQGKVDNKVTITVSVNAQ